MKPAQLRIFQALADLAIPLLGYFFWNWSFYFILLFFVLDYLVASVFSFVKVRKIASYREIHWSFPVTQLVSTVVLITVSLLAVIPALTLSNPTFNLAKETWAFLTYTELGFPIPQGFILLPILAYGGYAQYKMQFLMNGRFTTVQPAEIWKIHFQTAFIVLAVAGLFLGISFLVVFPPATYTLTLIFGVAAYRFFYSRT